MSTCFEWPFRLLASGYGYIYDQGKDKRAHRVAYEMTHGPIPEGMVVMHTCDNPSCVNPDHLRVGTQAENLADMRAKGRDNPPRGQKSPAAKLADTDIPFIRALAGVIGQRPLAKLYGVSRSTINAIQDGRKWKHIP